MFIFAEKTDLYEQKLLVTKEGLQYVGIILLCLFSALVFTLIGKKK